MDEPPWIAEIGASLLGSVTVAASSRKARPPLGPPATVTRIQFTGLRPWDGEYRERGPENAGKGRKQVYSLDGAPPERSCHEVEVAKKLRKVRDHAYWLTDWHEVPRTPWMPWALRPDAAPDWLLTLDREIRALVTSKAGGTPDVIAWDNASPRATAIYVECKAGEPFNPNQEDWYWAALEVGVLPEQLAVAQLPFKA